VKFRDIKPFTQPANYAVDVPIVSVPETIERWEVDLDPDFQRCHVWTEIQQIRYIEFLLRDGQSSKDIYFNGPSFTHGGRGDMVLVDGKQRLEAVIRFINNKVPVFGNLLSDFEDKLPWTKVMLKFHVNNLKTRAQVLQWYIDLNAGGVAHTSEEIAKVEDLLADEVANMKCCGEL